MADDDKGPIDQLLDLCLYGPLGLLVTVRMKYPQIVAQGRQHLEGHARVGRFVARFAATRGKEEAGKAMTRLRDSGVVPPSEDSVRRPVDVVPTTIGAEEVIPVRHDDDDPTTAASVAADELAIPAYDSLAASQVVQRLDGLTHDELEAVRRYEVAHRARKTVLGKVAQLQQRQS
jgi:hypothetical protein